MNEQEYLLRQMLRQRSSRKQNKKYSNNDINQMLNDLSKNNNNNKSIKLNSNINSKTNNNKICKFNINEYKNQILDTTEGLIKAYTNISSMSRDRLHELRGITKFYKKMLNNLLSDKCNAKKIFIENKDLIENLTKTVTTLLNFIDKLMLDAGLSYSSFDKKEAKKMISSLKKQKEISNSKIKQLEKNILELAKRK